jgi:hypothetical protein
MKKLLTIAALVGVASMSFGQGYVAFNNGISSKISINGGANATGGTNSTTLSPAGASSFYYALLVAPTTQTTVDSSLSGWTFAAYGTNDPVTAGRLSGNTDASGQSVAISALGLTPTSTANFVVVGWSANLGATYAQALAWWNNGVPQLSSTVSYFGISSVAVNILMATSGGPFNTMFGPTSGGQIPGMRLGAYVGTVPEPSTFALAGLGAAALLIFRRRK